MSNIHLMKTNLHDMSGDRRLKLVVLIGQVGEGVLLAHGGIGEATGRDRTDGWADDSGGEGHG